MRWIIGKFTKTIHTCDTVSWLMRYDWSISIHIWYNDLFGFCFVLFLTYYCWVSGKKFIYIFTSLCFKFFGYIEVFYWSKTFRQTLSKWLNFSLVIFANKSWNNYVFCRGMSKLMVKPKSTEEMSEILKYCNERRWEGSLCFVKSIVQNGT